jgi:hypothetical protein
LIPRLLNGVLRLRDLEDVEAYVTDRFEALPLSPLERDDLIMHGISYACRIDRALAPEQPLAPVLDVLLDRRVAGLKDAQAERLRNAA